MLVFAGFALYSASVTL